MMKALKIKSEQLNNLILSICKTTYFYDVIAEAKPEVLEKIKQVLVIESDILYKGIFGESILVIDTCEDEKDAEELFETYKTKICQMDKTLS